MENNAEHIPASIFDWMEKYDFPALTLSQQEEVLRYFSMEEYREMHQTVTSIKSVTAPIANQGREQRKQKLMARFDKKHNQSAPIIGLFAQPSMLWKAAAILLLVGSGWIWSFVKDQKHALSPAILTDVDTVYLTKEIAAAAVMIYDTIYVEKEVKPAKQRKTYDTALAVARQEDYIATQGMDNITILSIEEMENESNMPRGNSMKDDSLLKRYSFTTL